MCKPTLGHEEEKGQQKAHFYNLCLLKPSERGTRNGRKDEKKKKSEDLLSGFWGPEFGVWVFGRMLMPMTVRWDSIDSIPTVSSPPGCLGERKTRPVVNTDGNSRLIPGEGCVPTGDEW